MPILFSVSTDSQIHRGSISQELSDRDHLSVISIHTTRKRSHSFSKELEPITSVSPDLSLTPESGAEPEEPTVSIEEDEVCVYYVYIASL